MQKIIDKYTEKQRKFRSQPLISIETPLDTRFQRIRTQGMNFEKINFLFTETGENVQKWTQVFSTRR